MSNDTISMAKNLEKRIKKCKCGNKIIGINKVIMCGVFGWVRYWIECRNCGQRTEDYETALAAVGAWNSGNTLHWKDYAIRELLDCLESGE